MKPSLLDECLTQLKIKVYFVLFTIYYQPILTNWLIGTIDDWYQKLVIAITTIAIQLTVLAQYSLDVTSLLMKVVNDRPDKDFKASNEMLNEADFEI